jgi:hypothetical protein
VPLPPEVSKAEIDGDLAGVAGERSIVEVEVAVVAIDRPRGAALEGADDALVAILHPITQTPRQRGIDIEPELAGRGRQVDPHDGRRKDHR